MIESEKYYNKNTAYHYLAYRPALHTEILSKALHQMRIFNKGLDIGCGVGHSAIALSEFCSEVVGIEPGKEMICHSLPHDKVRYVEIDVCDWQCPERDVDIVTLAGSLYYCKSQMLLDKIVNICSQGALILIYDFEIDLRKAINQIFEFSELSEYNFKIDFENLDQSAIEELSELTFEHQFSATPLELGHLVLSHPEWYEALSTKYGTDRPLAQLEIDLEKKIAKPKYELLSQMCYRMYQIL